MNFIINRKLLLQALKIAKPLIERRAIFPALTGVSLAVESGLLTLRATDLELHMIQRVTVRNDDGAADAILVAFAPLFTAVTQATGESLTVSITSDEFLEIRDDAGGLVTLHALLPLADAPIFPVEATEPAATIAAGQLAALLREGGCAMADSPSRHGIHGVRFELAPAEVSCAGTDGNRLAVAAQPVHCSRNWVGVLPALVVAAVKGIPVAEFVEVGVGKDQVSLRWTGGELLVKPEAATFPVNYLDVIPRSHEARAIVPIKGLLAALTRAMAVQKRRDNPHAKFSFKTGRLLVEAGEVGEAGTSCSVPCEYEGEPLAIGANPSFLRAAITVMEGDAAEFWMRDAKSPFRVFSAGRADDFSYTLAPTRLATATVAVHEIQETPVAPAVKAMQVEPVAQTA